MHTRRLFARLMLALTLLSGAAPYAFAQTPAPVRVEGLKKGVTVRRDERGIPYIDAADESDLYFAQGYVTASDRLWQMDLLRRTARGELSEIFGRAALEEDKRRRTYGFAQIAEANVAQAPPAARAVLEAYARGVNAYIATLDEQTLPLEFKLLGYRPRPWTPADTAVIGKNFAEVLSTTWQIDLMRAAFADLPEEKRAALFPATSPLDVLVVGTDNVQKKAAPGRQSKVTPVSPASAAEAMRIHELTARSFERIGLYAEDLAASNNWVVSGRHTATGKPLLANDPHLSASAPNIWYLTHLSAPGLRVAGVTAPGVPGVIIGHNARVAWGVTNLGPDVQDVYREKFESKDSRRYMTPTGWKEAEVRREEIKVRKSPAGPEVETVAHEVVVTRNGPVVLQRGGEVYSLRWTALRPGADEFEAFYRLNRARNWKEFQDALASYRGPTQNFVYADVDGHIGYYGAGQIPVRKSGDGSTPYDGSTDAGEWTGFIPFAELPHTADPPSGIIVTANSRVVGLDYPHFLTHLWSAPTRARRIYDLLSAKKRMTAADFMEVQGDTYTISGATFAREVVEVARAAKLGEKDAKWAETLKLFETWDGKLTPDSRAARVAVEMATVFRQKTLEAAVGAERAKEYRWGSTATLFDRLIEQRPAEWLPKGYADYAELLDAVHREARASMEKRFGADESKWTWGILQVNFPHPLAGVPLVGGPFKVAPFPQSGGGGIFAAPNVGPSVSMRLVADAADWDQSRHGIALGQSGDPYSQHWQDQLADWRASTPRVFPFTPAAVNKSARVTLTLAPR
ncbi:MAG TPA: penicillin acylase family protein [Pyrinomonadaceae bacterium]|nr:penicillin acylase family protein [Pyrinomonadaceae bacterium]